VTVKVAHHPGPASGKTIDLHPTQTQPISLTLAAGIPLDRAIANAMKQAGLVGAWIEFADASVDHLSYVLPSDQPTEHTIVWYSDRHDLPAPAVIDRIGFTVGQFGGESFLHGHGLWRAPDAPVRLGHILPEHTILTTDVTAHGYATQDAHFDRRPDAETGFSIFQPRSVGKSQDADAAVLRILPNTEFAEALAQSCATLGWQRAKVQGLGSLIGADFEDGRTLDSFATEFLILEAETTPKVGETPGADIAIVGVDGGNVMTGRLSHLGNPVLVTAEVLLTRLA
jgi:hypothetical protein